MSIKKKKEKEKWRMGKGYSEKGGRILRLRQPFTNESRISNIKCVHHLYLTCPSLPW